MSFFSSKLILASACGSCLQQLCRFVTVIFLGPHFIHMCWNPSVKKSFLLPHLLMRSFIYISVDLYLFYPLGHNLIPSLFILLLLGSLSDCPCGHRRHILECPTFICLFHLIHPSCRPMLYFLCTVLESVTSPRTWVPFIREHDLSARPSQGTGRGGPRVRTGLGVCAFTLTPVTRVRRHRLSPGSAPFWKGQNRHKTPTTSCSGGRHTRLRACPFPWPCTP